MVLSASRLVSLSRAEIDSCCCAGMWDVKPEEEEPSETMFKVSDLYTTDGLMTGNDFMASGAKKTFSLAE